jgi:hypothetical protein
MRMKPTPGCSDFGPEFDRLKNIKRISLNTKLVAFVKKAQSFMHPIEAWQSGRKVKVK